MFTSFIKLFHGVEGFVLSVAKQRRKETASKKEKIFLSIASGKNTMKIKITFRIPFVKYLIVQITYGEEMVL